jgi:hypothetical protein
VARTWISYRCVPCHQRCTHRTSLVVRKNVFGFPVSVNNSIKVGPLVFLLWMFVITENIIKRPVYLKRTWIWLRWQISCAVERWKKVAWHHGSGATLCWNFWSYNRCFFYTGVSSDREFCLCTDGTTMEGPLSHKDLWHNRTTNATMHGPTIINIYVIHL